MYNFVNEVRPGEGFMVYGAAADLWHTKGQEVMIAGPAETGKTIAALHKLHLMAQNHKNAHLAMIRKTRKSMDDSVLKSFQTKVLEPDAPISVYGGSKPDWFDYPNGSRIVVSGMDNPSRILSSEYDAIYVNQAEELSLDEWETLTTRATGRAGNMPYSQVLGDCNPAHPQHWIKNRSTLELLHSRHEDNPVLYGRDGELTEQGKRTMKVLDALTGTRKERLRFGRWAQAEGVVYPQFDERTHIIDRFDIPADWRRIRVIDFGFVHPFVCGWWAIDHDGRMFLYREIFMTGRTVATHARQINELTTESISETICDHDAGDRQTLAENGIPNIAAKKSVSQGIDAVQDRLKITDGQARVFFLRDSLVEVDQTLEAKLLPTKTTDEFGGYIWNDRLTKEAPIKKEDDGMDMTRYAIMSEDGDYSQPPTGLIINDIPLRSFIPKRERLTR